MYIDKLRNNKSGFTIVELVIVIAVIAVLAAALIPTFSSVINTAKRSRDTEAAAHMNVALETSAITEGNPENYDELKSALTQGGYPLPKSADARNCEFYWIPEENRVVLFDEKRAEVVFPNELKIYDKSDQWICLSKGKPASQSEPEEMPEQVFTLPNGEKFNNSVKPYNPVKIVFGKLTDYSDKSSGTAVPLSDNGEIKAYIDDGTVYVLCNGSLKLPSDASEMFSGMTELTEIQFGTVDTSGTTDMHEMFYGCSKLKMLDISGFNTAKVINMTKMFADCTDIRQIDVTTGVSNWNIESVENGNAMFDNCKKLKNYTTDTGIAFIDFLLDKFFLPGLKYANTGENGFLTEK